MGDIAKGSNSGLLIDSSFGSKSSLALLLTE
jgi:hypothetical protein